MKISITKVKCFEKLKKNPVASYLLIMKKK